MSLHGEATRPTLKRELGLHEEAIQKAIRKMIRVGCVVDTGRHQREGGPNESNIFALGPVPFDQHAFSCFDGKRGRPRKDICTSNADALSSAFASFFTLREAA
ncbi:hypothetical protein C7S13_3068 [Burkholderia cepacia]|nr:hypothetical protein [Burkholderia cepacia]